MGHGENNLSDMLIYGIAFSIAAAIALAPQRAVSGSYDTNGQAPAAPRWSNDHHIADGLIVAPDCTVLPSDPADYVAGRDARGRPVVPAEVPRGHGGTSPVPVELDVHLGTKKLGGKVVDMSTGPIIYDPQHNAPDGYPPNRDCAPRFK